MAATDQQGTEPTLPTHGKAPNPFLSIWLKPRQTMRHLLETRKGLSLEYGLLALAGIMDLASRILDDTDPHNNLQEYLGQPLLLPAVLVAGGLFGILQAYVAGWLLPFVTKRMHGSVSFMDVIRTYAWSSIPVLVSLPFVFSIYLLPNGETEPLSLRDAVLLFGLIGVVIALAIWQIIMWVFCLAEAQGFSFWKAAKSVVFAGILLLAAVAVLFIIFFVGTMIYRLVI